MNASLYERLGGEDGVLAAVQEFYGRVVADEVTRPFFQGLDLGVQVKKQLAFMTHAFGGPGKFAGRDLRSAHAGLVANGLGDRHFDAIERHLVESLGALRIERPLIDEVLAIVQCTRQSVLGREH